MYLLPAIYHGSTSYLPTCLTLYNLLKFMYLQPTYLQLYYTYLFTYLFYLPIFLPNLRIAYTLPSLMNGVWNGRIKL
jgi:hypothetical protein